MNMTLDQAIAAGIVFPASAMPDSMLDDGEASFVLPVEVVSEMNRRDHWAAKYRRAKRQKQIAFGMTRSHARRFRERITSGEHFCLLVTMTRIMRRKQRPFDSDNLAAAFKAVRDGVAKALGIDDGSDRVDWRYGQERNGGRWSGIRIAIAENIEDAPGDGRPQIQGPNLPLSRPVAAF